MPHLILGYKWVSGKASRDFRITHVTAASIEALDRTLSNDGPIRLRWLSILEHVLVFVYHIDDYLTWRQLNSWYTFSNLKHILTEHVSTNEYKLLQTVIPLSRSNTSPTQCHWHNKLQLIDSTQFFYIYILGLPTWLSFNLNIQWSEKIDAIFQTTFVNEFSWKKIVIFW